MGSVLNEPSKLLLKPLGASVVILTPPYNIDVGNLSEGYEVSHNLNSEWVTLGSEENSSHSFSKVGIHDIAKWQFCKTTQSPVC